MALGLASVALGLYASRWEPYRPVLRRRRLTVPGHWPEVDILHLSDLHLRRSDPDLVTAQVRALSGLSRQPDLVCVTGDLCEKLDDVFLVTQVLRPLRPRLGTYVILGNHEYAAGSPCDTTAEGLISRLLYSIYRPYLSSGTEEGEAVAAALADSDVRVLRNAGTRLHLRGRSIWVAGVDSGWAGLADVATAMCGRHPDEGALVLVHEPELVFPAIDHGAELILAGHTHGGQVRVPGRGPLFWHRLDRRLKVPAGVQTVGSGQLHVTTGFGQLLPFRFMCPPEMVWLRCVPAGGYRTIAIPDATFNVGPAAGRGTSRDRWLVRKTSPSSHEGRGGGREIGGAFRSGVT